MAPQVDLFLDDEDIQAANAASSFLFVVPDDAVQRGKLDDPADDKAKASWVQALTIAESKMYEDKAKDKAGVEYPAIVVELKFQVEPDALRSGLADPNAGRSHTAWFRVVPAAMKNPQHPKYKANNFSIGKLNAVLRSIWGSDVIPHGVKVNLAEYYGPQGGNLPAVTGGKVVANVKAYRYNGDRKDELTDFVPLELQGA